MKKLLLPLMMLLCIGCKKETTNDPDNPNNGGNTTTTETITCRMVNSKSYNASGQLQADVNWYYTGQRPDSTIAYYYFSSGNTVSRTIYEHLGNNECNIRTPDAPNSGYRWVKFDANYNEIEAKTFAANGSLQSYGNTTYQCD